jgi:hypothetical protein
LAVTGASNPFNSINVGQINVPTFIDVNKDGNMDLVVGEGGGTLKYYENNGNMSFTERTGASNPFNSINVGGFSAPTFIDVNKDGNMDLAFILSK